jgi:formate hydrogenlyase subunit 3/multisubunit Na+/H+ antiporter MnhD subunit
VIGDNTLLHKEVGWPIVICALGIVAAACLYRLDRSRATIWAMLIVALGALIFGATVYQEAGGRASVEAEQFRDLLELIVVSHASPAIGLQLAKLAGILAVVSGLVLAAISARAEPHEPAGGSHWTS